ncbi:MAG: hypothetical protein [Bacteriophage sp.]|nr:MAG: hypothetical protein [Bacteriophage sp.]
MSDIVSTPTNVTSLVDMINAGLRRKLLTATNFTVTAIKPIKNRVSGHNTEVEVKIDLAADTPNLPIAESDRYSVRSIELTRINLHDIAVYRNLAVNDNGSFVGQPADAAAAIALLNANINPTEVAFHQLDAVSYLEAKPTSLGYIGRISFMPAGIHAIILN